MEKILGRWVPNDQMDPLTNIWRRNWMSVCGRYSGIFFGPHTIPDAARLSGLLWHFTPEQCGHSKA